MIRDNVFPNVPKIFSVTTVDINGTPTRVIVEERIEGTGLRDTIKSGNKYDLTQAVGFTERMLSIVDAVWAQRIVHRDIKPENIILRDDGELYLLDFGIARALDEASITASYEMGPFTPGYAAPEVFSGPKSAIDTRADLFSVGVVAYELITGENPFRKNAMGVYQILYNTTTVTPLQYSLKGDVQSQFMGLICSMMSRDRFARPRDAQEAIQWLEAAKLTFA